MIDLIGYEGVYKINPEGEIYSIPRYGTRGGYLKPRINKDGTQPSFKHLQFHHLVQYNPKMTAVYLGSLGCME